MVAGWDYPMGHPARMGPGYLPKILSAILIGFGVLISASGLREEGDSPGSWGWRSAAVITGAVVLFGVGINSLGLALTSVLVVVTASIAAPGRRWRETLPYAVALSLFCVIVFHVAIGLPLKVWPF